jgi:hypothetical protein
MLVYTFPKKKKKKLFSLKEGECNPTLGLGLSDRPFHDCSHLRSYTK